MVQPMCSKVSIVHICNHSTEITTETNSFELSQNGTNKFNIYQLQTSAVNLLPSYVLAETSRKETGKHLFLCGIEVSYSHQSL